MVGILMPEKALLKELAVRANNIIMKGSFTGDDITEASEIMKLCINIHNSLDYDEKTDRSSIKKS